MPAKRKTPAPSAVEKAADEAVPPATAPKTKRARAASVKELARETEGRSTHVTPPPPETLAHEIAPPQALPVVPAPFRIGTTKGPAGPAARYARKLRLLPEEMKVGDIALTESGTLLNSYLEYYGFTAPSIDAMNYYFNHRLPAQIMSRTITHPDGGTIRFENVALLSPSELNVAGDPGAKTHGLKGKALTPQQARLENATYSVSLYVDFVQYNKAGVQVRRHPNVFCGKIPLMLGSSLCHLAGKTDRERFALGECREDPLGYFIIEGTERVIVGQSKLRKNEIQLMDSKTDNSVMCKLSASTLLGPSSVAIVVNPKTNAMRLRLHFLGKNLSKDKPRSIPVLMPFRLLGIESVDEMLAMICRFTRPEYARKIWMSLIPSIDQIQRIGNDYEYISVIRNTTGLDPETVRLEVDRDLRRDLFSYMHDVKLNPTGWNDPDLDFRKLNLLAMMICRTAEFMAGLRTLDDRDDWVHKRVEGAATALESRFGALWKRFVDHIQGTIEANQSKAEFRDYDLSLIVKHATPETITDEFVRCFKSGNWGDANQHGPGKYTTSVVEMLRREGILSTYSQMLRFRTPSDEKNLDHRPRFVQFSQLRYVDAADTPEGSTCGLLSQMAQTVYPSIERDDTLVIAMLRPLLHPRGPTPVANSPCLVNGKFLGWIDGAAARTLCVTARRSGELPKDISILNDTEASDHAFYVFTDANRLTAPLLVVNPETGRLLVDDLNLRGKDVETLRLRGALEFISPVEETVLKVAPSKEILLQRQETLKVLLAKLEEAKTPEERERAQAAYTREVNRKPYTHCEIDPTAQMGVAAAAIPAANHNQAPRVSYQCQDVLTGILTPSGTREIGKLVNGDVVYTYNTKTSQIETTAIKNHFVIAPEKPVLDVGLLDRTTLTLTNDHKMWVPERGMVEAADFEVGTMLTKAFVPSHLEHTTDDTVVLTRWSMIDALMARGMDEERAEKHADMLVKSKLLPLRANSPALPILARLMGHAATDGSISLIDCASSFTGNFGQQGDASEFCRDLALLGFSSSVPKHHTYTITDKETGRTYSGQGWCVSPHVPCASLLIALGAMNGKKTQQPCLPLPDWIVNGSDLVKREFCAAFQGGDGCKMHYAKNKGGSRMNYVFCFEGTMKNIQKEHIDSLSAYHEQVATLFRHLGIDVKHVQVKASPNRDDHLCSRIKFADTHENLMRFARVIGYRYCAQKRDAAALIGSYLEYKNTYVEERRKRKEAILTLHDQGLKNYQIRDQLGLTDALVSDTIRWRDSPVKIGHILAKEILTPDEWCARVTVSNGVLHVPIVSIKPNTTCKLVADFETESPNHTFIAEGFVSSNCSMGRQALGIYHTNYAQRFDTTAKILAWPSRPIFEPQINQLIGLSEAPQGQTVRVMFGTFEGWGQEDAFVFNKESIEAGLFLRAKLTGHKIRQEKNGAYNDVILNPLNPSREAQVEIRNVVPGERSLLQKAARDEEAVRKGRKKKGIYSHLDERGIVKEGTYVKANDCLVAMMRVINERAVGGTGTLTGRKIEEDMSLYVPLHEEGRVMSVLVSNSPENSQVARVVRIQLQKVGKPELGDKFAPRHAQKGTIGLIVPQRDLPFDKNGVAPDMIINPHAMPSRMTMGLSLETIASKVGALTGETINATAFVKQDEDAFYRVLMQYGYHSNGSEEMYSGITGRKLGSGMMFVGPVFVQSLRHHVSDKYQSAYNPPIDPTTRQPVRGRNRGGAIRVGEMERDAFLGHAGTKLVQESLCLRSDATEVVFCKRCGTIAIEDRVSQETKCRKCKGEGEFARAVIPYIYLHMIRLLRAAGISMTVGTGSEAEGRRVNDMELLKSAAELKAEERAYEENKDADAEEEEIQEEDDFGLEDMDEYGGDEDGELYMD